MSKAFLLVGLACLACVPEPEEDPTAENASVVVMRTFVDQDLDPTDGISTDRISRLPACGGVAIEPRLVVTASHCIPEHVLDVAIVTRQQWFTTVSDHLIARVGTRKANDVVELETDEDLPAWTPRSPATQGRVLLVRRFETSHASIEDDALMGVALRQGDSGSGAFADGELVAIMSRCFADREGECDDRGGLVVRP